MQRLSSIIWLVVLCSSLYAQSPHGSDFKINCDDCHTTEGWKVDLKKITFNHDETKFQLIGQHQQINCKSCHKSLIFTEAETDCMSCHTDMHYQTVGFDCARCHTPKSWIVENITEIHQLSRFPLVGAHVTADCYTCHPSESFLRFEPLGVECYDCHQDNYIATTSPNHVESNFSINCDECHLVNSFAWTGADFTHNFFPLTGGHDINDCKICHTTNDYSNTSAECVSCHQTDYNNTSNPNHAGADISTNCIECHTTNPGWKPADFDQHDVIFPIYSGAHNGEWNSCAECHTTGGNYGVFSCIACHEHNQGDTDDEHDDVSGYVYNETSCYECHPTGSGEGSFNHNASNFPLTGAHITTECSGCHANGYSGTPTNCFACHENDFVQTSNPNHNTAGIATDCEACHTTVPEWKPALFPNHNETYPLVGAHATIAANCFTCHEGNYVNTPNLCYSCHADDYSQTTNPNHVAAQFSTSCETCHNENAWTPATFDHDGQYFPIYSGNHNDTWTECTECHTTPSNYGLFSCIDCHEHNQADTDEQHDGVSGYTYNSQACFECHPTGSGEGSFDHNNSDFPLTGAHITTDCIGCHADGYTGTPTICFACHEIDFNQSINPNHNALSIPNDCETCHTTNPDWQPATFPIHNEYYALAGAHQTIASNCFTCHEGNYVNTPNLCFGCHSDDYNQTTDPNHISAQFPTECESCHSEVAWTPATFDHDGQYFPIYSGNHQGEWDACSECHPNPGNYSNFTCLTCHEQGETGDEHDDVGGYSYNSQACLECHPDGSAEGSFNHNNSNFPLTGAHLTTECIGCHADGYTGTPTICFACHEGDFNLSVNPNHNGIGIPTDCESCHTTTPGWEPATFPIHNNYYPFTGEHTTIATDCFICHEGDYNNTPSVCAGCHMDNYNQTTNPDHDAIGIPTECETCHTTNPDWQPATFPVHNQYWALTGAHSSIASNCDICHSGNYNNTPNTCVGCHLDDYNQTADPNHVAAQFPTDCELCHTTIAWVPSTFDHDGLYFPIYSGNHQGEWDACSECHPNPGNYSDFTCLTCHEQGETGDQHDGVGGYSYNSQACLECHPDGEGSGSFNHNNSNFPLTGGHLTAECLDCHADGYVGTPTICLACHEDDFNQSVNPNHNAIGIPNNCESCHTTNPGWQPATFPIHDNYYPLTGEHQPIATDCFICHEGDYNNTPNACAGCHMDNYNQTTNPDHDAIGIPTECETCHTTSPDWQPATFPVHNQYWALTGAHSSIASNCDICHSGNYNNTPNTCAGCHLDDYNQTNDPNHAAAQFPTDCELCHTTIAWIPSTFDHDGLYFPIYSGQHEGEWNSCSECHPNSTNYSIFTCLTCHEQGETNGEHEGVSGYSYNSDACLNCHPDGEESLRKFKLN